MLNTIAVTLIFLIGIPIIIGFCLKSPKWVAMPIIAILIFFSASTWGEVSSFSSIYSRGSGELSFSLLNILLFIAGFAMLIRKLTVPTDKHLAPSMANYFIGFSALLLCHVIVGAISGIDVLQALSYTGIINVLNMLIFMYLVIASFNSDQEQKQLIFFIMALAAARAIFGLVRYKWFGGDSVNPYENLEGLDMKLVFFDISDNFICSLAAFWATWQLMSSKKKFHFLQRLGFYLFLALQLGAVILSFRRSSLLGLALMFVFLLFRMPAKNRAYFLVLTTVIMLGSAVIFFQQRLQYASKGHGNFISALAYDISPDKKVSSQSRFAELVIASKSMKGSWLTGLGTWGSFKGDADILDYHMGKYDFVHSGFGHIVLKTGFIGLALFCGMLLQFIRYYFKHAKHLVGHTRMLADMGFAGFLFWFPTLLIGTPIIEFRTMLLIGLTFALPFIAVSIRKQQVYKQVAYQTVYPRISHYAIT
jgi:hypothetical protein